MNIFEIKKRDPNSPKTIEERTLLEAQNNNQNFKKYSKMNYILNNYASAKVESGFIFLLISAIITPIIGAILPSVLPISLSSLILVPTYIGLVWILIAFVDMLITHQKEGFIEKRIKNFLRSKIEQYGLTNYMNNFNFVQFKNELLKKSTLSTDVSLIDILLNGETLNFNNFQEKLTDSKIYLLSDDNYQIIESKEPEAPLTSEQIEYNNLKQRLVDLLSLINSKTKKDQKWQAFEDTYTAQSELEDIIANEFVKSQTDKHTNNMVTSLLDSYQNKDYPKLNKSYVATTIFSSEQISKLEEQKDQLVTFLQDGTTQAYDEAATATDITKQLEEQYLLKYKNPNS